MLLGDILIGDEVSIPLVVSLFNGGRVSEFDHTLFPAGIGSLETEDWGHSRGPVRTQSGPGPFSVPP